MKFLVIACALLACAYADVSELSGYNYPQPAPPAPAPAPKNTYIPPPAHHEEVLSEPIPAPAPVAPANTYIPPAPQAAQLSEPIPAPQPAPAPAPAPVNTYIPPAPPAPHHDEIEQPAEDGYRYRTVRRRVFRHRA